MEDNKKKLEELENETQELNEEELDEVAGGKRVIRPEPQNLAGIH